MGMVLEKRIHVVGLQYLQRNSRKSPTLMFGTKKVTRMYLDRRTVVYGFGTVGERLGHDLLLRGL
jgi:hypothetical protein